MLNYSSTGGTYKTPAIGSPFDHRICAWFSDFSGLIRNLFGNHRCRVVNPSRYNLPAPGPERVWLRVFRDAVLVDNSSGVVVDIATGVIR